MITGCFTGTHVPDIVLPSGKDTFAGGSSHPGSSKEDVLAELIEVSKALQYTIRVSTIREEECGSPNEADVHGT